MKKILTSLIIVLFAISSFAKTIVLREELEPLKKNLASNTIQINIINEILNNIESIVDYSKENNIDYEEINGEIWVVNCKNSPEIIYIPRYRQDGREIKGIKAGATGFDNAETIICGCECIEVKDVVYTSNNENKVYSESAFTDNDILQTFIWTHQKAKFVGDIEKHFFTYQMTMDQKHKFGVEYPMYRSGPFYCPSMTTFIAPYLEDIPSKCFQGSSNLSSYYLPDVKNIGTMAFRGTAIKDFTSSKVEKIYNCAFLDCLNLTNVSIISFVDIGVSAFKTGIPSYPDFNASNTYEIGDRIKRGNTSYECTNQIPTPKAWSSNDWKQITIYDIASIKNLFIPNVVYIGTDAFYNQYNMQNLSSEYNQLKIIDNNAFKNSAFQELAVIKLPKCEIVNDLPVGIECVYANKAKKICTIRYLENLYEIYVNSLESIPDKWAYNNQSLEKVIAYNANSIGKSAFYNCGKLREIAFPRVEFIDDCAFSCAGSELPETKYSQNIYDDKKFSVNISPFRKLVHIGSHVFANSGIGFYYYRTDTNSVDGKPTYTFTRKPSGKIDNHLFPKLESCGMATFNGCQGIVEINLPKLKYVGRNFCGGSWNNKHTYTPATNVTKIILNSAIDIGGGMAKGCSSLETFSATSCKRMGSEMIANTPCNSSGYTYEGNYGLVFPSLLRCSTKAFAYATNATSFSARNLQDVSLGETWIDGAWLNIYVPSLIRHEPELYAGSDNLQNFVYHANADPDEWTFTLEDGSSLTKYIMIVNDEDETEP